MEMTLICLRQTSKDLESCIAGYKHWFPVFASTDLRIRLSMLYGDWLPLMATSEMRANNGL
jgi:hypothetical protein